MSWLLVLLLPWGVVVPALQALPTVPPVSLSEAWTTVPLPAMPLGIVEHNGTLWVCGADEMIASSDDAGQNWTVRHLNPHGEMLFSFAFGGPQPFEAFGTGGLRLASGDGGASWSRHVMNQKLGLTQVVLVGKTGYARTADAVATSHDGGESWQAETVRHGRDSSGNSNFWALAVLDAQHAAVEVDGKSDQGIELLVTLDAGHHCHTLKLPTAWHVDGLQAAHGAYHLYAEQGPGSARQPVAADSVDGTVWKKAAAPPSVLSECTAQGCLFSGGWFDWTGATPRLWQEPDDAGHPVASAWASTDATFCRASGELRCRVGQHAWVSTSTPPKAAGDAITVRCLSCPKPEYPLASRRNGQEGTVQVRLWIGTTGQVEQVVLLSAPTVDLAQAVMDTVKTWRYTPPQVGGRPRGMDSIATVNFYLGIM